LKDNTGILKFEILLESKYYQTFDYQKVKHLFFETYRETDYTKANEKYQELSKELKEFLEKMISMHKLYDNITQNYEREQEQKKEEEKYKILPSKGWFW
jgi:molecular chaperone GrpE (heat shock protein)